ncbi:MAG: redoxin domain-containing protein [bacterium]|nr:redoxin domain-containing protein [bacterium]
MTTKKRRLHLPGLSWPLVAGLLLAPSWAAQDDSSVAQEAASSPQDQLDDLMEPILADFEVSDHNETATGDEELQDLIDEYDDAVAEFMKAYRAAESDEERSALTYPEASNWTGRVKKIAEANPSTPLAMQALNWITENASGSEDAAWALGVITSNHIDSEELGAVAIQLSRDYSNGARAALKAMIENSPHQSVKGMATYAMAKNRKSLADLGKYIADADPDDENTAGMLEYFTEQLGEKRLANVQTAKRQKRLLAQYEKLMQSVADNYADVAYEARETTLGKLAARDLFELRELAVGRVAPDIEGEDIDGVAFKLSDYRGKVVMLDFWGHW